MYYQRRCKLIPSKESTSNPKEQNINYEKNIIASSERVLRKSNLLLNRDLEHVVNAELDNIIKSIDKTKNKEVEEEEETDLNELSYPLEPKKDKRALIQMIWFIFISKIDYLNALIYPNKYNVVCANLYIYMFQL